MVFTISNVFAGGDLSEKEREEILLINKIRKQLESKHDNAQIIENIQQILTPKNEIDWVFLSVFGLALLFLVTTILFYREYSRLERLNYPKESEINELNNENSEIQLKEKVDIIKALEVKNKNLNNTINSLNKSNNELNEKLIQFQKLVTVTKNDSKNDIITSEVVVDNSYKSSDEDKNVEKLVEENNTIQIDEKPKEISEENPTLKINHKFYVSKFNINGYIDNSNLIPYPSDDSYYLIEIDNNKGKLSFNSNNSTLKRVLNNPDNYLKPFCENQNAFNQNAYKITTVEQGVLIKEGNMWKVQSKAVIRYE